MRTVALGLVPVLRPHLGDVLPGLGGELFVALLDVLVGDLELVLLGDGGHEQPGAHLLLGVGVDAARGRPAPVRVKR